MPGPWMLRKMLVGETFCTCSKPLSLGLIDTLKKYKMYLSTGITTQKDTFAIAMLCSQHEISCSGMACFISKC